MNKNYEYAWHKCGQLYQPTCVQVKIINSVMLSVVGFKIEY